MTRQTRRTLLIASGVFAVTFAAAVVLSQWGRQQGWFAPATGTAPVIVGTAVGSLPAVGSVPVVAVRPVPWQRASVIVAGQRHALDGPSVSLPSGARFKIELLGLPSGAVEVHAVNPDGHSTGVALWAQAVNPDGSAVSPDLRLQGRQGLETLEVIHRGTGGIVTRRRVALWHL